MLITLPLYIKEKVTEWGDSEDLAYLVSVAINTAPPDSSVSVDKVEQIKINLSAQDELTLFHRSVMIGESPDTLLAQLLQNYV